MSFIKNSWYLTKNYMVAIFYDSSVALISLPIAYALRYDSFFHPVLFEGITIGVCILGFVLKIAFLHFMGVSRPIWKYVGTKDFIRIITAIGAAALTELLVMFIYNRMMGLPRSVVLIDVMISVTLLGGARLMTRILQERQVGRNEVIKKILLVGAGNAGAQLIKDSTQRTIKAVKVVALFDDDPKTHGRTIHGVKVVGGTDFIGAFAKELDIQDVVIAIPSASAQQIRNIAEICSAHNLRVKTLPALTDIIQGKVELSNIRPINIDDLLSRAPVQLESEKVRELLSDKVVLVTGAGGSIGSELCKQILKHRPSMLILFDNCEFFLYKTELSLKQLFPDLKIVPVVGDVRDSARVEMVLSRYQPKIVFHAAAYKHVPMMESNPSEAVKTNILGTAMVAGLSSKFGAERFVMVSSDKAVNPTNIMGATKRVAEMVCLNQNSGSKTQYSIIRFGNVLGSAGSVIPLFQDQIRRGGPVTVTHPEVTRYFMSIPEATQLVLEACSLNNAGKILVLEMGEPVKIVDLATDLIRLSGYEPDKDIPIVFTGLRPGEKLYEELLSDIESTKATSIDKIRVAEARPNPSDFSSQLDRLISLVNDETKLKEALRALVPEYVSPEHERKTNA